MPRLPSLVAAAIVILCAALPSRAAAADTAPPTIVHAPVTTAKNGEALKISAKIQDESEIFEPTLLYRRAGESKFVPISMEKEGALYTATIPASAVTGPLEYYLEAYDVNGNGPAASGSADQPHRVDVAVPSLPPPPPPVASTETKPPPKADEKPKEKVAEAPKTTPSDRGGHDDDLRDDKPIRVTQPSTSEPSVTAKSGGMSGTKIAGFALAGVGVAGLAAGTFFGLQSKSLNADAASDPAAHSAQVKLSDAQSKATLANIGLAAGGLLTAGGLVLALLPSSSPSSSAQILVGPQSFSALVRF